MTLLGVCDSKSTDIAEMCQMDVINIGAMLIAVVLVMIGFIHILVFNRRR